MIDVKATGQLATFSAAVGIIDGAIAAGLAAIIAGTTAAATSAFAVVGGVSTVVAMGAFAMCKVAAAADEAMGLLE